MFLFNKISIVLSAIACLGMLQSVIGAESYLETILNSLEDTLKFCVRHDHILDVNLLFGVTILSGQIPFINKRSMKPKFYRKLIIIQNMCDTIFKIAERRNIANINFDKIQQKLFSVELWSFDNEPSYLQNRTDDKWVPNKLQALRDISNSSVTFQKTAYEFCVRDLIEKCDISNRCERLILNGNSAEYVLTHQILYLLIFKQLLLQNWCSFEDDMQVWLDTISSWLNDKCFQLYHNEFAPLINNQSLLYNNATMIDLFTEQMAVCGLQSYLEFFHSKYIDIILNPAMYVDEIPAILDIGYGGDTERLSAVHLISVRIVAMILYVKQLSRMYFPANISPICQH